MPSKGKESNVFAQRDSVAGGGGPLAAPSVAAPAAARCSAKPWDIDAPSSVERTFKFPLDTTSSIVGEGGHRIQCLEMKFGVRIAIDASEFNAHGVAIIKGVAIDSVNECINRLSQIVASAQLGREADEPALVIPLASAAHAAAVLQGKAMVRKLFKVGLALDLNATAVAFYGNEKSVPKAHHYLEEKVLKSVVWDDVDVLEKHYKYIFGPDGAHIHKMRTKFDVIAVQCLPGENKVLITGRSFPSVENCRQYIDSFVVGLRG